MRFLGLPKGVQPDNAQAESGKGSFELPDVATPTFADKPALSPRTFHHEHEDYDEIIEDDDDDNHTRRKVVHKTSNGMGGMALALSLTAIAIALLAVVVSFNRKSEPLCSEQPEWNQYNCRS